MRLKYLRNVSTLVLDTAKCKGCGMCVEVCPQQVFALDGKKAVITDKDLCMECGACMQNCAFEAVTVRKGVGCASAVIQGKLTGTEARCGCGDDSSGSPGKGCCC